MTWNVEGFQNKLCTDVIRLIENFNIIGLQETWIVDDFDYSYYFSRHRPFICKAKRSLHGGRPMGGVIVLVDEKIHNFVKRMYDDFEYGVILALDKSLFGVDRDCIYICVYLPPEGSPFYENNVSCGPLIIENIIIDYNLTDYYVILNGDLNARTGKKITSETIFVDIPEFREFNDILSNEAYVDRVNSDAKVNKFGHQLNNFCQTYDCTIVNGRFGKDANNGHFTFINQNGCSVIDYFIVSNELISIIHDFEILSYPDSTHLPVLLNLECPSIGARRMEDVNHHHNTVRYNLDSRNSNLYVQTLQADKNKELFLCFEENVTDFNVPIDHVVSSFESAVLESSTDYMKTLEIKHYSTQKDWFDTECKMSKINVRKSLKRFRQTRNSNDLNLYLDAKNIYKKLCRAKKLTFFDAKVHKLEYSLNNSNVFWAEVRKIINKPRVQNHVSIEDWYTYFQNLLSDDIDNETDDTRLNYMHVFDELEDVIFNSAIDDDEILNAVKNMSTNKAFSGQIPPKFIKFGIPVLLPFIKLLFNRLYSTGEFPASWSKILLIPIYKKGNVQEPSNYRGVALMDVLSKIYISIVTKRLTFYVEAYGRLSESQAGFRSSYSTVDNAFVLYSIISKYLLKKKHPVYVAFIDFEKAFDSVKRPLLFNVLLKNGVKGNLFRAIESIYNVVKANVKSNNEISDVFTCPTGLRQGCPLSPMLFSLFINELDDVMKYSDVRGIQLFPDITEVFMLMFADDIGLISDTVNGLKKELNILEKFCNDYKLKVNINKTKIVVFKHGGALSRKESWTYNGEHIEVLSSFSYVGINFTNTLSMYKMSENAALKAKKVLNFLFQSFTKIPYVPVKTFF